MIDWWDKLLNVLLSVLIVLGIVTVALMIDTCMLIEERKLRMRANVPSGTACSPRPKRQRIGIRSYSESLRVIFFNADPGVAEELEEFGRLHHTTSGWYELTVDSRYDFGEVLAYLENDCEEVK